MSVILVSCSKEDVAAPHSAAVSTPVSYQDSNINIDNFEAVEVSPTDIKVSFSVLYENNVSKIEVLSGATQNQLCSFYQLDVTDKSTSATSFSIDDTNIKGSTMSYMIKYTLNNGNWGYTPVYSLQIK